MYSAVEEKVVHHAVCGWLGRIGKKGIVVPMAPEVPKVVVHPDRDHQQEREPGRVEQQVELV